MIPEYMIPAFLILPPRFSFPSVCVARRDYSGHLSIGDEPTRLMYDILSHSGPLSTSWKPLPEQGFHQQSNRMTSRNRFSV